MNLEIAQNRIIDFILNETRKAEVNGAVIGISGGIDSALAATLAVRALGKDHVPLLKTAKMQKPLRTGWESSFRSLIFQALFRLSWLQSLRVNLRTDSPWET